jgi:DNA invertase Pin-like site-specific DNA recombinase
MTDKRAAMTLIGYALVSTDLQLVNLQADALRKAGCERIFEDIISGTKTERQGLDAALAYLREGDALVVWKLDRLSRSMAHLVNTVQDLTARGVDLNVLGVVRT